MLQAIGVSAAVVAIAEIGDKTQLLTIVLAAKYRKPWPIIAGIFVATILNHAAAASVGYFISQWLTGRIFQTVMGLSFLAMAAWALVPDKEDEGALTRSRGGPGALGWLVDCPGRAAAAGEEEASHGVRGAGGRAASRERVHCLQAGGARATPCGPPLHTSTGEWRVSGVRGRGARVEERLRGRALLHGVLETP